MRGSERHRAILDAGGEIVTATARQARVLAAACGRAMAQGGARVFPAPRIVPYAAWLERQARALEERPQLLGAVAARRLWQLIVEDSDAGAALVTAEATAVEAARAWQLACDWGLELARLRPSTPEEETFLGWARAFERATAARGALDAARLPGLLAARLGTGGRPTPIGFHGFPGVSPARAALVAALAAVGTAVEELALAAGPATLARCEAGSPEEELGAIADWLGTRLAADPAARLIVLYPDLAAARAALARRLDERLAPELLLPGASGARPYVLGAPPRLADEAVVATAVGLLALAAPEIGVLELGRLLRSPYLPGTDAEQAARARLDAALRQGPEPRLRTEALAARLRAGRDAEPAFAALVEAVRAPLVRGGRQGAAQWAEAMQRALRAAGWPKGRALAASEYEAALGLMSALESLAGLETILPTLGFGAALGELQAILAATPVAAEAADPPVLILDALEDPALPCDGLWVAGLTADRFPAAAAPTPFLPLALQRARGLPGASAATMLAAAHAALAGWQRAAPELVLSAALADGELERRVSPLVPAAPALAGIVPAPPWVAALRAAGEREAWADPGLAAIPAGTHVRGGVKVLDLMAQCPFRAAAELRLRAEPLESPGIGLSARTRGVLAHEALSRVYAVLDSQRAIRECGAEARRVVVTEAIAGAFAAARPLLAESRLVAIERAWLERAILNLLAAELEREPFEVLARERAQELTAGGIALEVRIDRIDRLADGTTVVIDYKTGRAGQGRWTGPRPRPMQLPVYATLGDPPPTAVTMARLPPAVATFEGVAAREDVLPGVRACGSGRAKGELRGLGWPALVAGWRESVDALARGFAAGTALVDPDVDACRHCALATLCRVPAPNAGAAEEGGDD